MVHGVLIFLAAVVAQAAKSESKPAAAQEATDVKLTDARRLLRNGRYAEAEEALTAIENEAKKRPERWTPGLRALLALEKAECQASQGEYAKAIEGLKAAAAADPKNADLPARLADLYLTRGDWEAAEAAMPQAEKLDPDHLQARWVEARLLELRGELDKAVVAWKWFVDRYNEKQAEIVTIAEALLLVGQAAERYYRASARGEELSDSLNDVINEIYEAALRVDPNCWQAPLLEGRLFLSGYNERAAVTRAGPGPADQPAGARGAGDAGPGRLAGLPPGGGPGQGRTSPGHQPPLRAGVRAAGRPEHLRRAIRRRQGRRAARPWPRTPATKTPWRGWRPRAGCWSIPWGRPPPSWRPWRTTPGRRPSTPPWASGWPTAASTTRPNAPSCWPPPPTPPAPTPPSAWACSTCRSAARPRPRASSTPPSTPTRSTSAPTT